MVGRTSFYARLVAERKRRPVGVQPMQRKHQSQQNEGKS